jgi:TonB family protein
MANEILRALIEAMLAGTAACVLVLLLRRPWRGAFGAASLPWLWATVPAAMLAVLLPAGTAASASAPLLTPVLAAPAELLALAAPAADAAARGDAWALAALVLWGAGSLLGVIFFARAQRCFMRQLGPMRRDAGHVWRAERVDAGPAVIGILRPRIVLPADFETRFDPQQRALILAHEQSHLQRGDVLAQALLTTLRALYWFNPVFHLAASRLREDQELASDAAVLARFPGERRRYATTLLESQLAVPGLPVGCFWQSSHALKERIQMMKRDPKSRLRLNLGRAIALLLLGGSGALVWAAQPTADNTGPAQSAAAVDTSYAEMRPPRYPLEAIEARQQGKVVLRVLVGEDGMAQDVEVESATAPGVFDQVAIDAVATWRFNPGMRDGKVVPGWVLVPICFSLDGDNPSCDAIDEASLDGRSVREPG